MAFRRGWSKIQPSNLARTRSSTHNQERIDGDASTPAKVVNTCVLVGRCIDKLDNKKAWAHLKTDVRNLRPYSPFSQRHHRTNHHVLTCCGIAGAASVIDAICDCIVKAAACISRTCCCCRLAPGVGGVHAPAAVSTVSAIAASCACIVKV